MHYVPLLINGVPLVGLALLEDDRWEDTALLDDINRGHVLSTSPQPPDTHVWVYMYMY